MIFEISSKSSSDYETLQSWKIDLGQGNCIKHFQEQINQDNKAKNDLLLTGVSQGTATLTNWLAHQPEEQQKKVKGLVLESILGSGNSAILHTVEKMVNKEVTYLPFSRVLIPSVAKAIAFPTYNPLGKQVLKSAKKLPKDLPIVIMHAKNDPQLSINDARNLYCTLKNNGNDNAYLFEIDSPHQIHLDILNYDQNKKETIRALQEIYKKHNLPYNSKLLNHSDSDLEKNKIADLKKFQPPVQEVEKRINDSTFYSRMSRNIIDTTTCGLIVGYCAYKYWFQKK